ncbi:hypothetical protein [Streptomyces sp. MUM 178J]|uniref:hypothetical protein n=1 Tax=Streptomyces sp. MUM 178J TaxID=2791991 RepID=UPI001F03CB79|nr:hypothetical protein [Streptomyces sp. MUM 178J]WRQ78299.1 hypothetical protein I3F59_002230 [Streptomyces sp. MUM 178J]
MISTHDFAPEVVVTLSGCTKEDAGVVFEVLRRNFASDRADDDIPQDIVEGHPTVWTGTFEVVPPISPGPSPGPEPLHAAVTAEVQGGYWAVDRLREALDSAFRVTDEGMAAGDQEKDVQLRLESGGAQPVG